MKKLTNRQLKIIVALNFTVICLLISFWAVYPFFSSSSLEAGGEIEQYKRERTANISLNPFLSWELQLKGSLEEDVVFTYINKDTVYVFGNTLSSDYDFDSSGIFLIIMDAYGKTYDSGFISLTSNTDKLKKVIISNLGFILAIESDSSPYLMTVNFNGEIVKKIDGFINDYETICELKLYNDGYILLTKNGNRLRCSFFNFSLEFLSSTITESLLNLSPVEIVFLSSRVVVFGNALTGGVNVPMSIEFEMLASAKVNLYDQYLGQVKALSVNKGEFILLTEYQTCSILRLNARLEVISSTPISLSNPIFLTDLNEKNYAVFLSSSILVLNENLTSLGTLEYLNPNQFICVNSYTIFCGINSNSKISLIIFNNENVIFNAVIDEGINPLLSFSEKHIILTYNKGGNIIISSLRYPEFNV